MRKLLLGSLCLGWMLAVAAPPANAAATVTLADVALPDHLEIAGKPLVLNGLGLRKVLFVKVYVGALYLPAKQSSPAKVMADDTLRRMVLHFVHNVSTSQMCDAWKEGLENNVPKAPAEVQAGFKALCAAMEDIPSGTELVLTYTPGQGTLVEIGGKLKGTVPGKASADAMLATWIGPHPAPGDDFKRAVLGSH